MKYRLSVVVFLAVLAVLPLIDTVEAYRVDCVITNASNPNASIYEPKINVSLQGQLPGGTGIYQLYCSKLWDGLGNDTSFKYSDPVSGHVENASEPNYKFNHTFGNNVECTYRTGGSCLGSEVCAFEMSNITNAHVSDCSAERPESENYGGRLCCEVREICYNGIDDDNDGFTDCADTECIGPKIPNNSTFDPVHDDVPKICNPDPDSPIEANFQNTTYCVNNPGNCTTWTGNRTYCGYGEFDDPTKEPVGVCCPKGFVPKQNVFGEWGCTKTDECGLQATRPFTQCAYNISSQESDFFSDAYDGDANNFCNSQVPELFELVGEQDAPVGSAACCYVPHKGIEDWWFKDSNVQIYG